jgi:hypothetical protein
MIHGLFTLILTVNNFFINIFTEENTDPSAYLKIDNESLLINKKEKGDIRL